jgi:hypothetical protein
MRSLSWLVFAVDSGFVRMPYDSASRRPSQDPTFPQSWIETQPTKSSPKASLMRNPKINRCR